MKYCNYSGLMTQQLRGDLFIKPPKNCANFGNYTASPWLSLRTRSAIHDPRSHWIPDRARDDNRGAE